MASNVFTANAYQIGQRPVPLLDVQTVAFPTTGVLAFDTINSPTRSLSTGVNVYSGLQLLATGQIYYFQQSFSALVTLINAL